MRLRCATVEGAMVRQGLGRNMAITIMQLSSSILMAIGLSRSSTKLVNSRTTMAASLR